MESYDELFRPLEPFVAVFIAFGIPACVMTTDYCRERSKYTSVNDDGVDTMSIGTCDLTCELILSFRSVATVAVFFYSRENRSDFYNLRTLWTRLRARVAGWFLPSERKRSNHVRFRGIMLEEVYMIPRSDDSDDDAGGVGGATGATVPYELMNDGEIET